MSMAKFAFNVDSSLLYSHLNMHQPGFSGFIMELEDMDPPPTAGFFGFRFLVWIPSFFMEIGLFT